jgi:hypothetical protein
LATGTADLGKVTKLEQQQQHQLNQIKVKETTA